MFTRFPFRSSVSSYFRWRWFRTCLACGTCCTFGSARVAIYLLASTGPSFPLCWRRSDLPSPPRWASWPSPRGGLSCSKRSPSSTRWLPPRFFAASLSTTSSGSTWSVSLTSSWELREQGVHHEKNCRQSLHRSRAVGIGLGPPCQGREMAELGKAHPVGCEVAAGAIVLREPGHVSAFERIDYGLSDGGV